MAQSDGFIVLSTKHKELKIITPEPTYQKSGVVVRICIPMLERQTQESSSGSLASQPNVATQ